MNESVAELVSYRLSRARESLERLRLPAVARLWPGETELPGELELATQKNHFSPKVTWKLSAEM